MEKIYRVQMNKNGMPNFATAEEVVFCKDCKHCRRKKGTFRGEPIFFYRCEEHNRDVESDDYCSWGEER